VGRLQSKEKGGPLPSHDTLLDGLVQHGHIVLEIFVAPVDPGLSVFLALPGRTAGLLAAEAGMEETEDGCE
jgi:hypothetical protein